ncbi:ATP-binding protein [Streptomyces roseicoloratus]|uniref:ATP-binding protein n=1 Tax=Streptomyces roseicoloratus TaxID=2508722 RepID=UPI001009B55A|nr:ATP-binding protein [Streptomyces roseicoloratus]
MKTEMTTPTGGFRGAGDGVFAQRLSSTRRGARLARLLAVQQMRDWGLADTAAAELVVAELAANAVTHGRVPGRDFEVRLVLGAPGDHLRIEVSDTRAERLPEPASRHLERLHEHGYGLPLVEALAAAWGVKERSVGKTVWATVPTR